MTKLVAKQPLNNTTLGGLGLIYNPTKTRFEKREKDGFVAKSGDDKLVVGGEDFGYFFGKPKAKGTITDLKYVSDGTPFYLLSGAEVKLKDLAKSSLTTATSLFFTGDDLFVGSAGNDAFFGGKGDDTFKGRAGIDNLQGQAGKDILDGGKGADRLDGGSGRDTYAFTDKPGTGADTIVKFQKGEKIHVAAKNFAGLTVGELADDAFVKGSAATEAGHRFVHNPANGALYYDPDGVDGAAQVQIAVIQKNPGDLDAGSIFVI